MASVLERVAHAYDTAACQTDPALPKRVRRKLSLVFHPDKGGDDASFQEVERHTADLKALARASELWQREQRIQENARLAARMEALARSFASHEEEAQHVPSSAPAPPPAAAAHVPSEVSLRRFCDAMATLLFPEGSRACYRNKLRRLLCNALPDGYPTFDATADVIDALAAHEAAWTRAQVDWDHGQLRAAVRKLLHHPDATRAQWNLFCA